MSNTNRNNALRGLAALAVAGVCVFQASAASAAEFDIDEKFAHVDGESQYIETSTVDATISAGSDLTINTADFYDGRSASNQANESVTVTGIRADGTEVVLGSTQDLADGTEEASASTTLKVNDDIVQVRFDLNPDRSTPNSVFVEGFSTAPSIVEEAPEEEVEEEAPVEEEVEEETYVSQPDPTVEEVPSTVPTAEPAIETAVTPEPLTELPYTGAKLNMAFAGAAMLAAGVVLTRKANAATI